MRPTLLVTGLSSILFDGFLWGGVTAGLARRGRVRAAGFAASFLGEEAPEILRAVDLRAPTAGLDPTLADRALLAAAFAAFAGLDWPADARFAAGTFEDLRVDVRPAALRTGCFLTAIPDPVSTIANAELYIAGQFREVGPPKGSVPTSDNPAKSRSWPQQLRSGQPLGARR
jgi:hypothetical protein